MKTWKPYERKFLPLHEKIASGLHPEEGFFELLISVPPSQLFVSLRPAENSRRVRYYELTMKELMDGFFEYLKEQKKESDTDRRCFLLVAPPGGAPPFSARVLGGRGGGGQAWGGRTSRASGRVDSEDWRCGMKLQLVLGALIFGLWKCSAKTSRNCKRKPPDSDYQQASQ